MIAIFNWFVKITGWLPQKLIFRTKIYYEDITEEWLHNSDTTVKEIYNAKYVIKNGKR